MRAIWSGMIGFGLVYIPVQLYNATESQQLDFDLLRRSDRCRIRYRRVCEETGEEVPYEDIVRGYEYQDGRYVVLEDEDFERANVRKTRTIEILQFADAGEIDPRYLSKPYYLEPEPEGRQGYLLLRRALEKSKKVGIAHFVLRTREHLAMLQAHDEVLVLNRMRFAAEIRPPEDLSLPKNRTVDREEMDMALRLIDQLSAPWEPERYRDTYTDDLKRIIEQRIEGRAVAFQEEPLPEEVADLFSQLRRSLEIADRQRQS